MGPASGSDRRSVIDSILTAGLRRDLSAIVGGDVSIPALTAAAQAAAAPGPGPWERTSGGRGIQRAATGVVRSSRASYPETGIIYLLSSHSGPSPC